MPAGADGGHELFSSPMVHQLNIPDYCNKKSLVNDLQLRHELRSCRLGNDISRIPLVLNHPFDVGRLELSSLVGTQPSLIEHLRHGIPAGTFFRHFHKYFPDPFRFIWIDFQIFYGLVSLIDSTFINGTISVRDKASSKVSTRNDLTDTVSGSHGGFFALPCCLPEPDIVHELIAVVFDTLLAFVGAPHLLEHFPLFLGQDRPDQKIFALVWRYLLQQGPGSPMVWDAELWPENVLLPFHPSLTAP